MKKLPLILCVVVAATLSSLAEASAQGTYYYTSPGYPSTPYGARWYSSGGAPSTPYGYLGPRYGYLAYPAYRVNTYVASNGYRSFSYEPGAVAPVVVPVLQGGLTQEYLQAAQVHSVNSNSPYWMYQGNRKVLGVQRP